MKRRIPETTWCLMTIIAYLALVSVYTIENAAMRGFFG